MGEKTTAIDWLNIGLMLASAGAAYFLPFELFLLSYAILGPLHYLTEISWLQQRDFFARRRWDFLGLLLLGVVLFFISFAPDFFGTKPLPPTYGAGVTYAAFMIALAVVLFRDWSARFFFGIGATVLLFGFQRQQAYLLFFAIFLPTLVHVYVFTAAFMLYGALKSRSSVGVAAVVLLLVLGLGLLLYQPADTGYVVSEPARVRYAEEGGRFDSLNRVILHLFGMPQGDVYSSPFGLALMRFIAFAYTYHYLNWFSKTSIIKWHLISKARFAAIGLGWLLSVGLYAWNYRVGFIALYTLSFLHVYLEFPLNHQCFLGIGRELRERLKARTNAKPLAQGAGKPKLAAAKG